MPGTIFLSPPSPPFSTTNPNFLLLAIPLPLALPAAAASLAYLSARLSLPNDISILTSLAKARIRQSRLEKRDRINVFYSLEDHALSPRTAHLPCLVYEGQTWTFQEAYENVLRYAGWLSRNHGVQKGEIVALDFMNCPPFVFLCLALWSLGAVPAFVNYNLSGGALVHCVRVSTARVIIVDPEVRAGWTEEVEAEVTVPGFRSSTGRGEATRSSGGDRVTIVHFDATIQSSMPYQPPHRAPDSARSKTRPRDPAILIYTSGTTGLPKPAISSWTKLHVGGAYVASWMGLRPATHKVPDRFYCCMPLYHSSGSVLGFSNCLINGTTFILGHRFSTRNFWKEIRHSEATIFQYVGETCRYLLSAPAEPDPQDSAGIRNLDRQHQIRIAFGNGLRPDVWDRFKARFGIPTIAEFYAATEGTSGAWNYSSNSFAAGAVGRNGAVAELILNKQICVVELDYEHDIPVRLPAEQGGLCVPVPRGEAGELLYALDPADISDRFQGYFGHEEASAKKVLRDVLTRGDAWFRTGDVMRWDGQGRWWFVDRIGDTYRWKSENVSTAEVADCLGGFVWGGVRVVEEANVYGVEVWGYEGRAGCAAVVLKGWGEGGLGEKEKEVLMADLADYVSSHLPKYGVPVFLRLVTQMQRTGNMKQQKQILRTEGVDLDKVEGVHGEEIWWLTPGGGGGGGRGGYVRFRKEDWEGLMGGRVKL